MLHVRTIQYALPLKKLVNSMKILCKRVGVSLPESPDNDAEFDAARELPAAFHSIRKLIAMPARKRKKIVHSSE